MIPANQYDIMHQGEWCTVEITKPADYQYRAWHAVITLTPVAAEVDPAALRGLRFPTLPSRLLIAEKSTPYHAVAYPKGGEPDLGFAFVDGRCELDIYSSGCEEDYNPTPLIDVAEALAAVTDERLKPFLA